MSDYLALQTCSRCGSKGTLVQAPCPKPGTGCAAFHMWCTSCDAEKIEAYNAKARAATSAWIREGAGIAALEERIAYLEARVRALEAKHCPQ